MPSQSTPPFPPHLTNVQPFADQISNAADPIVLSEPAIDGYFVDPQYGNSWSFIPPVGAAVYGKTDRFKPSPVDHLAKGKFLRVPFRRIPVIEIDSLEALKSLAAMIYSMDPDIRLMWRGQTRQYLLNRSEEDSMRLFGEPSVAEPSLPSSGARINLPFNEVFKEWSAILDAFIQERVSTLSKSGAYQDVVMDIKNFQSSYNYRLWAFATAQHYGLPSVGLDVTSEIAVALLFALYRFSVDGLSGRTEMTRLDKDAEPVLYAMGAFKNDLFDDADLSPRWLHCLRPKAQAAFFLATGWGLSPNRAAQRVFVAIKLRNHATWKLPRPVESLLPSSHEDSFLNFLLRAKSRYPSIASAAMLDKVYYAS